MPRFDGTGPVGRGPLSGSGRGECIMPIRPAGDRVGRGFGRGLGLRARRWEQVDGGAMVAELARLRDQVAELQQSLQQK